MNWLISPLTIILLKLMCTSASSSPPPPPHEGEFPNGTLHNGVQVPLVGLGCASGVRRQHVETAFESGYRFFDTAQSYNWGYREDEVGQALQSVKDRAEVFVQTKIHPEDLGYDATKRAVDLSLQGLGVDHIESVLIHKPRCWEGACSKAPEGTWEDSWRALEELYDDGIVGAIGICDVDNRLLDELLQQRIKPHIIQNWMDPLHQDVHVRERCRAHEIQYQGYSSLGTQWVHFRGHKTNPVLMNPTLVSIADAHRVSVAQVVINWATRHGVSVLPASTNVDRQKSNLDSFGFDLTEEEMYAIDELDGKAPRKSDPNEVSVEFINRGDGPIHSFWVSSTDGKEVPVGSIGAGDAMPLKTFHGHRFVFKDESGLLVGEHTVARDGGSKQRHEVGNGEL